VLILGCYIPALFLLRFFTAEEKDRIRQFLRLLPGRRAQ
jgi:hypothetical protein